FEQVQGAEGVHFKIDERYFFGFVVGGLRRTMNDQVEALFSKQIKNLPAIANVNIVGMKVVGCRFQPLQVPRGISRWPKKEAAHIAISADNSVTLPVKMHHGLGANEATAASYEDHLVTRCLHFCAVAPAGASGLTPNLG